MVTLKINQTNTYGIKQSGWNNLFNHGEDLPYYFYYDKKEDLENSLKRCFSIDKEDCEWSFHDIGYHYFEKGFFSNTYYVSCSNCNKGKISGQAVAKIANVKIVKESANPSSPSNGWFSNDVLEDKYVLWDIELKMKCDSCDKISNWTGLVRTNDDGSKQHWNFSKFSNQFSNIN